MVDGFVFATHVEVTKLLLVGADDGAFVGVVIDVVGAAVGESAAVHRASPNCCVE